MKLAQCFLKTEIGALYLVASEKGLRGIFWDKQTIPMTKTLLGPEPEIKNLRIAAHQMEEYFQGKRKTFDLPLDLKGSPFQMQVWRQLAKIPYGKTVSYREIAQKIKNEKAVRAVGNANGKNPVCIVIPCHRVIASDGSIGGYTGGLHIKEKLLRLEQRFT